MELPLYMLFLVVFCGQPIWMVNNCPHGTKTVCPQYTLIEETPTHEKREYNRTEWMAVEVHGEQDSDFLVAHLTLKNVVGNYLKRSDPWPVLIMKTNDGKVLLGWFCPPNVEVPDHPPVLRVKIPKSIVCVRQFGGTPTIASGRANAKRLCEDLGKPAEVCLNLPFNGAGYEPISAFVHHNEVWIDCE